MAEKANQTSEFKAHVWGDKVEGPFFAKLVCDVSCEDDGSVKVMEFARDEWLRGFWQWFEREVPAGAAVGFRAMPKPERLSTQHPAKALVRTYARVFVLFAEGHERREDTFQSEICLGEAE